MHFRYWHFKPDSPTPWVGAVPYHFVLVCTIGFRSTINVTVVIWSSQPRSAIFDSACGDSETGRADANPTLR